jgi:ankyrin repeat protein
MFKFLIKNGANVNISNSDNDTPLSLAIQKRNKNSIKLILDKLMYQFDNTY